MTRVGGRRPTDPIRLIGLTGGIASGKSTAARLFAEQGARVVDADEAARRVVEPGRPALAEIRESFGPGVFRDDGRLDRAALGELVFGDPEARRRLDAIVHPRVEAEVRRQVEDALRADPEGLVVYDVPLLYETGLENRFDLVVVVYVPREVQRARLMARNGLTAEQAESRLASQLPIEDKAAKADEVLDNRGSPDELRRRVLALLDRLRAENRALRGL